MVQTPGEVEHFQIDELDPPVSRFLTYLGEPIERHGHTPDVPPAEESNRRRRIKPRYSCVRHNTPAATKNSGTDRVQI
jgi:hypothetical protein